MIGFKVSIASISLEVLEYLHGSTEVSALPWKWFVLS